MSLCGHVCRWQTVRLLHLFTRSPHSSLPSHLTPPAPSLSYSTGQGSYYRQDGSLAYKGAYLADKRHGQGEEVTFSGDRYTGYFVNGQRHGTGVLVLANGDRFEGTFR